MNIEQAPIKPQGTPPIDSEELLKQIEATNAILEKRRLHLEKQEEYFEKRRKELPEKIYHVTTRENAEQILKEGLDPSRLIFNDDMVVSLSDDIDFALDVAQITQEMAANNLVVLEIDTQYLTPSRIRNYLREADPDNADPMEAAAIHEIHYETTIPAEAIRIVKNH